MVNSWLFSRLDAVVRKSRQLRDHRFAAIVWTILLVVVLVATTQAEPANLFWIVALGFLVTLSLALGRLRAIQRDEREAAIHEVERQFPELDCRLLTAAEQKPALLSSEPDIFAQELRTQLVTHSRRHRWTDAVSSGRLLGMRLWHGTAAGACLAVALLSLMSPAEDPTDKFRSGVAVQDLPAGTEGFEVVVEPGDAEVERGTGLLVTARFEGAVPGVVTLVTVDSDQQVTTRPLRQSLKDPLFGTRIPEIQKDLTYHIEFDGERSEDFEVRTYTHPELVQADALVNFPSYTGLEDLQMPDVRRISVVEGSKLSLTCQLNKPVAEAELIGPNGEKLSLTTDPLKPQEVTLTWTPTAHEDPLYLLELVDADGRRAKESAEFTIEVVPNRRPDLKIAFPSKDVRVSPLEEMAMEAVAKDDFGLNNYGVIFETVDGGEQSIQLGSGEPQKKSAEMSHMLPLENLGVVPDQLVTYYFFAEDVGPDGTVRTSYSDVFFAEVRPFEEIYRQAPPQEGQAGPPPGQSQRILELQRQVVSAIWNLIRRETNATPSSMYQEDVGVIRDSQLAVRGLVAELAGSLDDAEMRRHATDALEFMSQVIDQLEGASSANVTEPLPEARKQAQQAYQALLRLQAREHMIMNANASGAQGGSSSKQLNEQLKALELKNDRDRYETERQAQIAQEAANRETLQVLNRLKELARRQEAINNRIRELQDQLRSARNEEERQEIERELRRLQQEQRELLRDVDELRERMQREENRERMADAREQVDETRERVYRSAEALEEGRLSQALNEGTRAERDLNELNNELRKQAAGQFDEAVRELQQQVHDLAEKQQELAEELAGGEKPEEEAGGRRSLRAAPTDRRDELVDDVEEQRARLSHTLDSARELVEESEDVEPLLSKHLYDTLRDVRKYSPEEALGATSQLLARGFEEEAKRLEQQARQGIDSLQRGIDNAAESLLGDETEGLRRAQEALDELTDAIASELDSNAPRTGSPRADEGRAEASGSRGDEPRERRVPAGESPGEGERSEQSGSGERPGEEQSQPSPGEAQSPGEGESSRGEQEGQTPSESGSDSSGQSPSESPSQNDASSPMGEQGRGEQPGQSMSESSSSSPGQSPSGSPSGSPTQQASTPAPAPGDSSGGSQPGQSRAGGRPTAESALGAFLTGGNETGGGSTGPHMPLTGGDFLRWSDGMRNLEEMVSDPDLRSQIAMVRDRARQLRIDVKRHSKAPDWDLVRTSIYGPMLELQKQIAQEIARREPDRRLVPIDRDPVPEEFESLVREYYERLSRDAGE